MKTHAGLSATLKKPALRFLQACSRLAPASLSGRLLLASFLVLPFFVLVSGKALENAFEKSQMTAERDRLQTHMYLLLGAAELYGKDLWLPEFLQEPRFNQPQSGLYARVHNLKDLHWESASIVGQPLPSPTHHVLHPGQRVIEFTQLQTDSAQTDSRPNASGVPAVRFTFDVSWDDDAGREHIFRFELIHDQTGMLAERKEYRRQLWRGLGFLILALISLQWLIQYWGLRPLCRLAKDLEQVELGQTEKLPNNYPQEIQPVTTNLNRVLAAERSQRDKYRNSLSDLAHSLKTPLAVMRGSLESEKDPLEHAPSLDKKMLNDQLSRMNEIVQHQLHRARVQQVGMPGKGIALVDSVTRLSNALSKVYQHKGVEFDLAIPSDCHFYGEEGDLMEVMGNLLENACKYGHQRVRVIAQQLTEGIELRIEDDGKGIEEKARQTVLQRGARADTATSGQGIGLAVVTEILSSYSGGLRIEDAALGGAAFIVLLPKRFAWAK